MSNLADFKKFIKTNPTLTIIGHKRKDPSSNWVELEHPNLNKPRKVVRSNTVEMTFSDGCNLYWPKASQLSWGSDGIVICLEHVQLIYRIEKQQ